MELFLDLRTTVKRLGISSKGVTGTIGEITPKVTMSVSFSIFKTYLNNLDVLLSEIPLQTLSSVSSPLAI
jgi:hypothetical protein